MKLSIEHLPVFQKQLEHVNNQIHASHISHGIATIAYQTANNYDRRYYEAEQARCVKRIAHFQPEKEALEAVIAHLREQDENDRLSL